MPLTANQQAFAATYTKHLAAAAERGEYAWPAKEAEHVAQRMLVAVEKGSFNKDGPAFKATCKELGIKHTYTAIKEFWSS